MDISSVATVPMASAGAGPLPVAMEAQVAMLRELAESQQEIAQLLIESGLGQTIDVMA
jgi:hypothetical protein